VKRTGFLEKSPMPFPYTIDASHRVAIIRKVGRVDVGRIRRTVEALFTDPVWQPGFDTIWDDSQTTELLLEREDLITLLDVQRELAHLSGPGRDVMAATRPVDQIMGQIFSMYAKDQHRTLILCKSMAEAREVLGLPEANG
jgi:hypothetical protein